MNDFVTDESTPLPTTSSWSTTSFPTTVIDTTTTEVMTTTITTTTTEPTTTLSIEQMLKDQCQEAMFDVTILLDGSGSVSNEDYSKAVDFIQNLINPMNIQAANTRVTLAQFSYYTRFYTALDYDKVSIDSAIEKLRNSHYKSQTYTNYALDNMLNNVLQYGRPNARQFLILITDGKSSKGLKLKDKQTKTKIDTAKALHDNNIVTFAIGVGQETDREELEKIASDPDEDFKFDLDSYDALEGVRSKITEFACESRKIRQLGRSGGVMNSKFLRKDSEEVRGVEMEIAPWGEDEEEEVY